MTALVDMLISPDIDAEQVRGLAEEMAGANNAWYGKTGKPPLARELLEALLCLACEVIKGAPDEATRAAMAATSLSFIMRNCGAETAEVFRARVAMLSGRNLFPPAGSA